VKQWGHFSNLLVICVAHSQLLDNILHSTQYHIHLTVLVDYNKLLYYNLEHHILHLCFISSTIYIIMNLIITNISNTILIRVLSPLCNKLLGNTEY